MMQTRKTTSLKWGVFIFNFIIGVTGTVVLVASLRILFDADYSHLLFHGSGNYLVGHVLVAAGTSLIIVSLIGCVGVVKGNTWLLGLCFLLLIFIIATQISFGVVAYSQLDQFHEKVHLGIFWGIQRYYGNDISNTTVIDVIQQNWHCCGLHSYSSWSNSLYSKRHVPKGSWPTNIFIVPKSCCVDSQSDLCEDMHLNGIRNFDTSIPSILYAEGCGPKVMNVIDYYVSCLFGFGVAVVVFEACATILSGYLLYRLVKIRNLIQFKSINSPDSSTLLASTNGEQQANSTKQSSTSSPTSYSPSRMSLIVPEILPTSSLV